MEKFTVEFLWKGVFVAPTSGLASVWTAMHSNHALVNEWEPLVEILIDDR